jgi:iron complex outermembrane receptor protein
VTDRLRLLGGLRYSDDKQEIAVDNQTGFIVNGVLTPSIAHTTTCPTAETDFEFQSWTGKGGAQYDVTDNKNVYATISNGYLDGGLNAGKCPKLNVYNPEKITAYETGFKGRFFDNHLIFNASAFFYDFTNLQVSQTVNLSAVINNAGSAHVKGLELESTWIPDTHWSVNANLTLLDARYVDFFSLDALNPGLGAQDVAGNYLNNSPKLSGSLGVAYQTDKFSWGDLTYRADLSARSRFYFREYNGPLDAQTGYGLLNLNLIWNAPDERYSVRLFDNNVLNTPYEVTLGTSNNFGARFIAWGNPRQIGVEVKAKF